MLMGMPCRPDIFLQCPSQQADNQPKWSEQTKNNDGERQIWLRNINFIFVWEKVWVVGERINVYDTSLSGRTITAPDNLLFGQVIHKIHYPLIRIPVRVWSQYI